jgi:hypothetical protein
VDRLRAPWHLGTPGRSLSVTNEESATYDNVVECQAPSEFGTLSRALDERQHRPKQAFNRLRIARLGQPYQIAKVVRFHASYYGDTGRRQAREKYSCPGGLAGAEMVDDYRRAGRE